MHHTKYGALDCSTCHDWKTLLEYFLTIPEEIKGESSYLGYETFFIMLMLK